MGDLYFHKYGRLLVTNFLPRSDFRYGSSQIARHIFWRFWWLS